MNIPKEGEGNQEDDDNSGIIQFNQDQIKVTSLVSTESSWVTLYENVLSPQDSEDVLNKLHQDLPWNVETDQFGPQSRPTCYFADPKCTFSYVGLTLQPNDWHPMVQALRDHVTLAATDQLVGHHANDESPLSPLTACLVNLYPPGEGFIPWHYDEIRAHGPHKIVASLSLGGPRRFQLRTRDERQKLMADLWLPSGSLLLMKGQVQEHYEHCLPLETEESNDNDDNETINPLRISLTFRSIVPGYEENRQVATDLCTNEEKVY